MKRIKRYTQEEALRIIHKDDELEEIYKELQDDIENFDGLDHSFDYGNFFSFYDREADVVDKNRVVIQWCSDDDCAADDANFDYLGHEVIAESLEEAIVIMRDIENADGKIIYRK